MEVMRIELEISPFFVLFEWGKARMGKRGSISRSFIRRIFTHVMIITRYLRRDHQRWEMVGFHERLDIN